MTTFVGCISSCEDLPRIEGQSSWCQSLVLLILFFLFLPLCLTLPYRCYTLGDWGLDRQIAFTAELEIPETASIECKKAHILILR